jgi:glycerate kinase
MKIVIAPDSFKGSITAVQAAAAIEKGIRRAFPTCNVDKIPMADGGEGTVDAMISAAGGKLIKAVVCGPLSEEVEGFFGILGDGKTAVIETASASGLTLIPSGRRNPMLTTTFGTGQLISKALDQNCRKFIIGLGGSATVDGGTGLLNALGVKFNDKNGVQIPTGGGGLEYLCSIDPRGMDKRIRDSEFLAACDVDNPLCGDKGAARVYGPQKGATAQMVKLLDKNLENYGNKIKEATGRDICSIPGAGAAGGLGAGIAAFLDASLVPGVDIILDAVGFEERVRDADLVITGEGRMDYQTLHGKVPMGVTGIAQKFGIPVVAIAGDIKGDVSSLHKKGITAVAGICPGPMLPEQAMKQADVLLADTAERVMRLIGIGLEIFT